MTQAVVYAPTINFEDETTGLVAGRSTVRPNALDAELANIALSIVQLCYNLSIIQRDDTELRDGIVKPAALAASVLALIGSATGSKWTPRGPWVTATAYVPYDFVETGGASYLCLVAHTSGTFNTDKTAGKWMVVGPSLGTITAANVPFTPVGTIAASTAQAAIAEAAADAVQKADNGGDFASVSAVRTNLAVPSKAEMQRQAPGYCQAAGTSDVITGAFTPAITSLALPLLLYVEAVTANTTTTPTFQADATAAKTIVKGSNAALIAGDIPGTNFVMLLAFDVSLDKYVLLNPASLGTVTGPAASVDSEMVLFSGTDGKHLTRATTSGWVKMIDGVMQPGAAAIPASQISGVLPTANLGSGTANSSTVLYGDQVYRAPAAVFVSAATAIVSGGAFTIAHGLGAKPSQVTAFLVCVTTEGGYATGEELHEFTGPYAAANVGYTVYPDATNLLGYFGSATSPFSAIDKNGSGARFALTNASWNIKFRAAL